MAQTAAPTSPSASTALWKPRFNPWVVALTVTLATFMEILDTSIANVALPHIAGGLSASQDESAWVLTSYLVANAIILPVSAWLSVLLGRKRFYMTCVVLFTASSFLCGFAQSLGMLVLFRVLQGLGGGGLATSEQAILADTFSPEKRGMAFAVYGMAVVMAPAIGPTFGGWITDNFSWRWIFYINVPVGIISLLLTQRIVEDPPYLAEQRNKVKDNPLDLRGLFLITLAVGVLQIVLDKGQESDWFDSAWITTGFIVALIALGLFIWHEWHYENPVLDLRLLKRRNFAIAVCMMFVLGMVLFGTTVLIPQFLQVLMGYDAQTAGMAISAGAVVLIFMMPIVGRMVTKLDPRKMVVFGFVGTSLALFHMTSIYLDIDFGTAAMMRVYQTFTLAFIFIPINTLSYVDMDRTKSNQIAGMTNLFRNLGGSVGISMLGAFLTRLSQTHQTYLTANTTPTSLAFQQRLAGLTQTLVNKGIAFNVAQKQAYAMMQGMVAAQATVLAYKDIISFMAVAVLCLAALPMLMKRPQRGLPKPAGGAH